jgi:hypothetical protein
MIPGIQLGEYGGEALFFLGVAWRLATWLVRTSSELQNSGSLGPWGMSLMTARAKPTPIASVAALAPSMTPEQRARVIAMITDKPEPAPFSQEIQHHCPKCGTLIHADLAHGGFGPCRKCGWSASSPFSAPVA